jgi:hypothetical protein
MNEFGRRRGGSARQILSFAKINGKAASRGVPSYAATVDPAAYDREIVSLLQHDLPLGVFDLVFVL